MAAVTRSAKCFEWSEDWKGAVHAVVEMFRFYWGNQAGSFQSEIWSHPVLLVANNLHGGTLTAKLDYIHFFYTDYGLNQKLRFFDLTYYHYKSNINIYF